MSTARDSRPEPHVGDRVRILGGGEGRVSSRDPFHLGKWIIQIDGDYSDHIVSTWPGEFTVITDHEGQQP